MKKLIAAAFIASGEMAVAYFYLHVHMFAKVALPMALIPQLNGSNRHLPLISSITLHISPLLPLPASPWYIKSYGFESFFRQKSAMSFIAAFLPIKCFVLLSLKFS